MTSLMSSEEAESHGMSDLEPFRGIAKFMTTWSYKSNSNLASHLDSNTDSVKVGYDERIGVDTGYKDLSTDDKNF